MRHNHSRRGKWTPTYSSWAAMVQRCTNPARNTYKTHGARGVSVCSCWLTFANFLADMGLRPRGCSIDRYPDKDGNYEPGNCRWATPKEQSRNRTNNKLTPTMAATIRLDYEAGRVSQRELGEAYGVSKTMIRNVVTGRAWA